MFKPHLGTCLICQKESLLVVKKGWCKKCNHQEKVKKKGRKIAYSIKRRENMKSGKALKKELDKVFSEYIRRREANPEGVTRCFTCGKIGTWESMDCGHYESRAHLSTRWDEENCHVQCKGCNIFKSGNYPAYAVKLQEMYGDGILKKLYVKARVDYKPSRVIYEQLINYYKTLCLSLK